MKKECDTCGFNTATHYTESDLYHEQGQGEYACDDCYGGED
jgi:hypothetical protein